MDVGTIITIIVAGLVLTFLLILPRLIGSSQTNSQVGTGQEKAYNRGLMIGALMEEARQKGQGNPSQIIEQVMAEQTIIEHFQQRHSDHSSST